MVIGVPWLFWVTILLCGSAGVLLRAACLWLWLPVTRWSSVCLCNRSPKHRHWRVNESVRQARLNQAPWCQAAHKSAPVSFPLILFVRVLQVW